MSLVSEGVVQSINGVLHSAFHISYYFSVSAIWHYEPSQALSERVWTLEICFERRFWIRGVGEVSTTIIYAIKHEDSYEECQPTT
jgi:hypothetical protein